LAGPNEGAIYYVHDQVHIKVEFRNGYDYALYNLSESIKFAIQKHIPMPELNELITTINARDLYKAGEFVFEAKEKYINNQQNSVTDRIRASWDGGYSDSNGLYINIKV
ncbi:hypothetical protein BG000_000881, partial [Podila horticola]